MGVGGPARYGEGPTALYYDFENLVLGVGSFTSSQARQLRVTQPSNHLTVSINQFFCHPKLRIFALHTHLQATQPLDYSCRNTLRAERLRYLFSRIVGLSQCDMR